jgi:DNA polymerase-3 subunit epsilon
LADAEMTAYLWMCLIEDIKTVFGRPDVPFSIMQQLGKTPKKKVAEFLAKGKM